MPPSAAISEGIARCQRRSIACGSPSAAYSMPEGAHADHRELEGVHDPQDREVGDEEAGHGDEHVGHEGAWCGRSPSRARARRGCRPERRGDQIDQRSRQGTAAPSSGSGPRSLQHGLAVLERAQLAGDEVAQPVGVLRGGAARRGGTPRGSARCPRGFMRGFIGSTCARLARREVHDGERDHRDHEQQPSAARSPARGSRPRSAPSASKHGDRRRASPARRSGRSASPFGRLDRLGGARRRPALALHHRPSCGRARRWRARRPGRCTAGRSRSARGAACASASWAPAVVLDADPLDQAIRLPRCDSR